MAISKEEILEYNKSGKEVIVTVEELLEIYLLFERPIGKGAIIDSRCYVSFKGLENIQFIIESINSFDRFEFIEQFEKANLDEKRQGFLKFFFLEFWQGKSFWKRLFHLIYTLTIILLFNFLIIQYSSEKKIANFFMGILTAVSIFVAIFSVFTANHDQLNRKKPFLFKTGKMSYYFSVDMNLTIAGLIAIFTSLVGIIIVNDDSQAFIHNIMFNKEYFLNLFSRKGLVLFLMNTTFLLTFITLRSLVEFYIHRPAKYITGEMKDNFLKEF